MLYAHAATGDVGAVCRALSRLVFDVFAFVVELCPVDCVVVQEATLTRIDVDDEVRFEDMTIDCRGENRSPLKWPASITGACTWCYRWRFAKH